MEQQATAAAATGAGAGACLVQQQTQSASKLLHCWSRCLPLGWGAQQQQQRRAAHLRWVRSFWLQAGEEAVACLLCCSSAALQHSLVCARSMCCCVAAVLPVYLAWHGDVLQHNEQQLQQVLQESADWLLKGPGGAGAPLASGTTLKSDGSEPTHGCNTSLSPTLTWQESPPRQLIICPRAYRIIFCTVVCSWRRRTQQLCRRCT